MAQTVGPEALGTYLNVSDYLKRRATALGVDTEGLIRTEEEIAAQQQQSQQMAMLEKLGPQGIKSVTDIVTKGTPQGAAAPEEQQ